MTMNEISLPRTGDRIFISSTLLYLSPYREMADNALADIGLIGLRLEQLQPQPPAAQRDLSFVKANIEACRAVLAIKGSHRGAQVPSSPFTFTDYELNTAAKARLPIFLFATPGSGIFDYLRSWRQVSSDELAILENCVSIRAVASPAELGAAVKAVFLAVLSGDQPRRLVVLPRVDHRLIRRIIEHPQELQTIPDRLFEELIADLLSHDGWAVDVVVRPNAPGPDIIACSSKIVEEVPLRLIVECKRYRHDKPVDIREVRNLVYWVNEEFQATLGMIATTSRFTSEAQRLVAERHRWRISLRDHNSVIEWLRKTRLEQ